YTDAFFVALATALARRVDLIRRPPVKVIVTDCDHTLWQGVCGEDPLEELIITPAHRRLHQMMLQAREHGVLLALCSKNNPDDVWSVLTEHPDIDLRREHFVATKVNWQPKGANLTDLANELNLDPSSFVFLDDNPAEIAQIRSTLPGLAAFRI